MVWPYGSEHWCNLEGIYLHIVADLSDLMTAYGSFDTSICTVGVFGTRYVRDGDSLPTRIEIEQGATKSLSVPHIYSELVIGTTLAINLRQASDQLSFVSFEENSGATEVLIDTSGVDEGEYSMVLESFNTLSLAKSALKTDII